MLAEAYAKKYPQDTVTIGPALGTPGGIKALNAKAVDIALASRALNDAERASGLSEIEFARTPLVMAVAAANPLNDIGFVHLARLYATADAIWPDGTRVRLVLRPRDDADTRIVSGFSADMAKAMEAALARPGALVSATDEDAISSIQRLPGAIGPTTLAQILIEKRPLKALSLESRPPTVDAARAGRTGEHGKLGSLTLAQLVHEWAFHDLGHIRQIAELVRARCHYPEIGPFQSMYHVRP